MNQEELRSLFRDYRVLLLIALLIISVISIYPHFESYEVVTFSNTMPVDQAITALNNKMGVSVKIIGLTNETTTIEIPKAYSKAEIDAIFSSLGIPVVSYEQKTRFATNLQFGLDLQEGSWLQLEFKAAVVGYQSNIQSEADLEKFISALKTRLDADIEVIGPDKIEIRKYYSREELEPIFAENGAKIITYQQGVSKETASDIKRILEQKVNFAGTQDAKVNTITGLDGITRYIRVELAGKTMKQAQDIVGKQGKFEIRVQTDGGQTEHVIYGDTISSVSNPSQEPPGSNSWGVGFTLSDDGAKEFRDMVVKTGAVDNPESHQLFMLLDNVQVYGAPLSPDLAARLKAEPVKQLYASTGSGTASMTAAQNLEIHLRAGALPVDVSVAGSGSVSAALGEHFKTMVILAALLAILTVGLTVYFRYREPAIVLPMMAINVSELIILLGISRWIIQLDLATIAGLIAVLGTGIDQLVIITDEILHEGRVPSPTLYRKRLARALTIIVASASTVIIAMIPLVVMDLSTLRGFALITIIGVFVGVVVTRPAYGRIIMAILSK
jgi:preprotein translocase subunit SecD